VSLESFQSFSFAFSPCNDFGYNFSYFFTLGAH